MTINEKTIKEKFEDFTEDRTANKNFVILKGKTPVIPGSDTPLEWRKVENRYTWDKVVMIPGDGIGIILNKTGLTCLDFDKCLDENGRIKDGRIEAIINKLGSWVEISRSGTGLHAWIITDANTKNQKRLDDHIEVITDGNVALTGNSYPPMAAHKIELIDANRVFEILGFSEIPNRSFKKLTSGPISSGNRNNTLFSIGGSLRSKGLSAESIFTELSRINKERCTPPLPVDEIRRIAESAGSYPAGTSCTPEMLTENGLTEVSCADGFLEQIDGRFVFNKSTKQWHKWNGKNWEIDIRDRIVSECKEYLYGLYKILPTLPNQSQQQTVFKKIQALNSRAGINNVVAITSTSALVLAEDFDTKENILNVKNGTIEFNGDEILFREHRKEDMCSSIANVEYKPEESIPEIWTKHVDTVMRGDADLIKNLQFVLGYTLEGGNPLERFTFMTGSGRNGKSVTLRTFSYILGDYAIEVNPLSLMENGNKQASPERRKMRGKRFILAQETRKPDDTARDSFTFDSGFIKAASGKDKISARDLHTNNVEEFFIKGQVILSTNNLPKVNDNTTAFWDRIIIIPFNHYFPDSERIVDMDDRLRKESSAILNWLIEGWREFKQQKKFTPCQNVADMISEYRTEADEYSLFVRDCVERKTNSTVGVNDLFIAYSQWCRATSQTPVLERVFNKEFKNRYPKKRNSEGIVYLDISLKPYLFSGQLPLPPRTIEKRDLVKDILIPCIQDVYTIKGYCRKPDIEQWIHSKNYAYGNRELEDALETLSRNTLVTVNQGSYRVI